MPLYNYVNNFKKLLFIALLISPLFSLAQYCDSYAEDISSNQIQNVTLGGENQDINNNSSTTTEYTYTDNTASVSPADMYQDSSYTLYITKKSCVWCLAPEVRVWIDWNNDSIFDNANELLNIPTIGGTDLFQVAFTVPSTASIGTTRMRIILKEGALPAGPCNTDEFPGEYLYGETEDYNVSIIPLSPPSSPGGVGTEHLTGWFKADELSSGDVSAWGTSYPINGDAISVIGSAPHPQCDPANEVFNYNKVIDFVGNATGSAMEKYLTTASTAELLTNQTAAGTGTFFSTYASASDNDISGNNNGVVSYKKGDDGLQLCGFGQLALGEGNSSNGTRVFPGQALYKPLIISYKGNKSSANSMEALRNDKMIMPSSPSSADIGEGLTFGASRQTDGSYTQPFDGYLSEVIFFDADLSDADIKKVNSYLAVKYGITLDNNGSDTQGDYHSTDGTLIWDASEQADFHNNVIGIGRDDDQALMQKQSHALDDSTRVYLGAIASTNESNAAGFSTDKSYVLIGSNDGHMNATEAANLEAPTSCALYSRIARELKVTRSQMSDDFNLDIKLSSNAILSAVNPNHLRLLITDDSNFSSGTSCYHNGDGSGLTISYNPPVISITGVSTAHVANNSTAYITLGSINPSTPLPIELLSYTAVCEEGAAVLQWTTLSEVNNDYFAIERSPDALHYTMIGTLDGSGTSAVSTEYTWRDNSLLPALSYYRLRQVDYNGEYELLGVEAIACKTLGGLHVYPNPTGNSFTVELPTNISYPVQINVADYAGRTRLRHQAESNEQLIELGEQLPAGVYHISVSSEQEVLYKKVVKH